MTKPSNEEPSDVSIAQQKKANRIILLLIILMAIGTATPLLSFYFFR